MKDIAGQTTIVSITVNGHGHNSLRRRVQDSSRATHLGRLLSSFNPDITAFEYLVIYHEYFCLHFDVKGTHQF